MNTSTHTPAQKRELFMRFFRHDEDLAQALTPDDREEIFRHILLSSDDFNKPMLDSMFADYGVDHLVVSERVNTFTIHGSHGDFIVDMSGKVISLDLHDPDSCDPEQVEANKEYLSVLAFDMDEWREYLGVDAIPKHEDILDFGIFYADRNRPYGPPAHEWREERKRMRKGLDP